MSFESALLVAVLMLLGNAFFVGAEFGLVSARRSSIELRALNGSRAAKVTLDAMEHVSLMLAGAQLGVTLCSLILGAVGEPLFAGMLHRPFVALGLPEAFLHPLALGLALALMVYLHVVIGEMVPKNLALASPDRAALLLTPPLALLVRLTRPVVLALNALANATLHLIGVKPQPEIPSTFTRDEVAGFVKESRREGLLSEDEEQLLAGALRFDERTVRSVLLPTSRLVTATPQTTPTEIEKLAAATGYSRFPVRNARGKLSGYIHLKDILKVPESRCDEPIPAKDIRPLAEVQDRASLRSTLTAMQRSGSHLAQVVDRNGKTLGVVTLEDVLEELVGEIRDDSQKRRAS
jgi:CBS domain containing-hemolysin-like protein